MKNIQEKEVMFPVEAWGKISDGAKDMILMLMEKDPWQRPTAVSAKRHMWLRQTTPKIVATRSKFDIEGETLGEEMYNLTNLKKIMMMDKNFERVRAK